LKSTCVAVEVGAVDTGEPHLAADGDAARAAHAGAVDHDRVQRHQVFTPNGRVVSTQARIIGSGPMATTRSGGPAVSTSCSAVGHQPGRP
jgi:hypothetical protein